MKELEKMIIGACYGENQFDQVSFLEANDFTVKSYGQFFGMLKSVNGNTIDLMEKIKEDKKLLSHIFILSNLLGCNNIQRIAMKVLELRFKTLLSNLLTKLSTETKNALERELLNECNLSITKSDIFDLGDNLLEYVGSQASGHTIERINSYLTYRDKRTNDAKQIINGTR